MKRACPSRKVYEDIDLILQEKVKHAENEKWRRSLLLRLFLAIVCCQLLFGVIFGIALVKGASMEPSYSSGDIVIFCRLYRNYSAGDVLLIRSGKEKEDYLKRIVALPGQMISIEEGFVIVDGKPLTEGYAKGITKKKGVIRFPLVLSENEYFVLGDNRENSIDSRNYGAVNGNDIDGRVIAMFRMNKRSAE